MHWVTDSYTPMPVSWIGSNHTEGVACTLKTLLPTRGLPKVTARTSARGNWRVAHNAAYAATEL